jgi:hypothetical protein
MKLRKLSGKMSNKKKQENKEVPLGVKIISVIFFIESVLYLIFVIFEVVLIIKDNYTFNFLIVTYDFLQLLIGVSCFLIGIGLWKLERGVKTISIIFLVSVAAYYMFIERLIFGTFWETTFLEIFMTRLIILSSLVMAAYLLFNKKVKEAFKK